MFVNSQHATSSTSSSQAIHHLLDPLRWETEQQFAPVRAGVNVGKRGDNEGRVCESSDGSRGCSVRGQLKRVIGAGIHSGNEWVSYPSFCDLVRLDTSLVCERGWCKSLMGMRPWKYWGPNQGHEVPLLAATWYADREVRPRLW